MQKLSQKEISSLVKRAGFKSKAEFSRFVGYKSDTVSKWGFVCEVPSWFLPLITMIIELRQELIKRKE